MPSLLLPPLISSFLPSSPPSSPHLLFPPLLSSFLPSSPLSSSPLLMCLLLHLCLVFNLKLFVPPRPRKDVLSQKSFTLDAKCYFQIFHPVVLIFVLEEKENKLRAGSSYLLLFKFAESSCCEIPHTVARGWFQTVLWFYHHLPLHTECDCMYMFCFGVFFFFFAVPVFVKLCMYILSSDLCFCFLKRVLFICVDIWYFSFFFFLR